MDSNMTNKMYTPYVPPPDDDELVEDTGPSVIADFFAGQNVFITGATGFIGKVLIEKLLRSCPDVKTVYLLVRPKKGKNSAERFNEITDGPLYARLKERQPNFRSKLVMIEGETGVEDLGLSAKSREILRCVNVVFHAAATVRFNDTVRNATSINVRGTKLMLLLAKEMPNLKAFVHVSTAFSHSQLRFIAEKFYDASIAPDNMIRLLTISDEELEKLLPRFLGKWPNIYALSKAVGENTVQLYGKGLPVCVCRPSIVVSTAEEPIGGWTNFIYGATGVVLAGAVGLLRTMMTEPEYVAEIIPVDYVVANIIASAWDVAMKHEKIPLNIPGVDKLADDLDTEEIPIYNIVSSCQRPLTWKEFLIMNSIYTSVFPSNKVIWHQMHFLTRNSLLYAFTKVLFHYVPALIVDAVAILIGRKPKMMSIYKKIHKFSEIIAYFATREWRFRNENVVKLWSKITPGDRRRFNFYLANLDWHRFMYYHTRGIRIYLVNDPLETIPAARPRYRKLKIAHYTLLTFIGIFLAYMVYVLAYYLLHYFCPWLN